MTLPKGLAVVFLLVVLSSRKGWRMFLNLVIMVVLLAAML